MTSSPGLCSKALGDCQDLALARDEDEDVAGGVELPDGVFHAFGKPLALRKEGAKREMADFHGKQAPFGPKVDTSYVIRHLVRVHRRRHDHQARLCSPEQRQQEIDVEPAFVELVEDDRVIGVRFVESSENDARCGEEQAGIGGLRVVRRVRGSRRSPRAPSRSGAPRVGRASGTPRGAARPRARGPSTTAERGWTCRTRWVTTPRPGPARGGSRMLREWFRRAASGWAQWQVMVARIAGVTTVWVVLTS